MAKVFSGSASGEVYIVKGLLEQHGIEARVEGEYLRGAVGELPADGMIALHVDEADKERAQALISDYERGHGPVSAEELNRQALAAATPAEGAPPRRAYQAAEYSRMRPFAYGFMTAAGLLLILYYVSGRTDPRDTNRDGYHDVLYHYRFDRIDSIEQDRNYDGKFDLVIKYAFDGSYSSEERDDNFDGKIETWGYYTDNQLTSARRDADSDGEVDQRELYKHQVLQRIEFLDPATGLVKKALIYENLRLTRALVDDDLDGRFDREIIYDALEDVQSTRSLQ